jgi:hypothetical protein
MLDIGFRFASLNDEMYCNYLERVLEMETYESVVFRKWSTLVKDQKESQIYHFPIN